MKLANKFFFILFHCLRCAKLRSLSPLKDITFQYDLTRNHNYRAVRAAGYGYQFFIQSRYRAKLHSQYPDSYNEQLFRILFPQSMNDMTEMRSMLSQDIIDRDRQISAKYNIEPATSDLNA